MTKNDILNTELAKNQTAVFYLGQEGFLIKYKDKYILTDPYLSDYVDKNCCSENVKWIRKYDAPIAPTELDFVDFVLCTHSHYDHSDPITLSEINKVNKKVKFIASASFTDVLSSYGIESSKIIPAEADKELSFDDIKITPIPSAHEELHIDKNGYYEELGFIIRTGDTGFYHAGDCCVYKGLAERIKNIDIAFLPINGRDFYRYENDIIGNMDSREAILLAKQANIGLIVPMHFDLYDVNDVNPAYFVDCIYKINPTQCFHIFMPGEKYIY